MKRAHAHRGTSFVEIFQNCIVYNDAVFDHFADRAVAAQRQIHLEHGEPLLFGKDSEQGLRLKPASLELEVVTLGENGIGLDDILVHDETNRHLAGLLAAMEPPTLPIALGVLYCDPAASYEALVKQQLEAADTGKGKPSLESLLRRGHTWTVDGPVAST